MAASRLVTAFKALVEVHLAGLESAQPAVIPCLQQEPLLRADFSTLVAVEVGAAQESLPTAERQGRVSAEVAAVAAAAAAAAQAQTAARAATAPCSSTTKEKGY